MFARLVMSSITASLLVLATGTQPAFAQKTAKPKSAVKVNALEKSLSEKLTNATLVGSFTVDGKNAGKPPRAERYELGTVKKVRENYWLFVAKVKYGNKNFSIPVPITVKVLWAGDTPVVTLTDLTIPTMGTFTARVLFYGDRYVGTWQHGKVGGHMFGKIEPAKKKAAKSAKTK
ncbi:MAG: hypothetical protein Tsb009_35070 [Planctomycetaceae bacterium]